MFLTGEAAICVVPAPYSGLRVLFIIKGAHGAKRRDLVVLRNGRFNSARLEICVRHQLHITPFYHCGTFPFASYLGIIIAVAPLDQDAFVVCHPKQFPEASTNLYSSLCLTRFRNSMSGRILMLPVISSQTLFQYCGL